MSQQQHSVLNRSAKETPVLLLFHHRYLLARLMLEKANSHRTVNGFHRCHASVNASLSFDSCRIKRRCSGVCMCFFEIWRRDAVQWLRPWKLCQQNQPSRNPAMCLHGLSVVVATAYVCSLSLSLLLYRRGRMSPRTATPAASDESPALYSAIGCR